MITIVLTEEQADWLYQSLTSIMDLHDSDDPLVEFIEEIRQQLEVGGA